MLTGSWMSHPAWEESRNKSPGLSLNGAQTCGMSALWGRFLFVHSEAYPYLQLTGEICVFMWKRLVFQSKWLNHHGNLRTGFPAPLWMADSAQSSVTLHSASLQTTGVSKIRGYSICTAFLYVSICITEIPTSLRKISNLLQKEEKHDQWDSLVLCYLSVFKAERSFLCKHAKTRHEAVLVQSALQVSWLQNWDQKSQTGLLLTSAHLICCCSRETSLFLQYNIHASTESSNCII